MGYAVASMNYRLLPIDLAIEAALGGTVTTAFVKAVWRGVHDSRAAVRFFRRSVAEFDNPYDIDVNRIYLGGISAGAFIAVHHAYVTIQAKSHWKSMPLRTAWVGAWKGCPETRDTARCQWGVQSRRRPSDDGFLLVGTMSRCSACMAQTMPLCPAKGHFARHRRVWCGHQWMEAPSCTGKGVGMNHCLITVDGIPCTPFVQRCKLRSDFECPRRQAR